jgi:hypothetical protein
MGLLPEQKPGNVSEGKKWNRPLKDLKEGAIPVPSLPGLIGWSRKKTRKRF